MFQATENSFGLGAAYVVSSLLFGLGHFPVFGANTVFESFIGAAFALSYSYSGNNIFVPILCHTLYDFVTIFIAWYSASTDLRAKIKAREEKILGMSYDSPAEIELLARSVFDILDLNKDGLERYHLLTPPHAYR